MAAVELAAGIWRIPTAPFDLVNSFLLADDDGSLTLVDAGLPKTSARVLGALAQLGKQPGDVQRILLSHAHVDHAGGLRETVDGTGARVLTHDREAVYVREGRTPPYDGRSRLGRLLSRAPGGGFARTDVEETFADGAVLPIAGGLQVVHTPGHSPGHCSFLHPSTGVLLVGDGVMNLRGLRYPPVGLCTDGRMTRASADRLGTLDVEVAAFGHGTPVTRGAATALRAFLAGRAS